MRYNKKLHSAIRELEEETSIAKNLAEEIEEVENIENEYEKEKREKKLIDKIANFVGMIKQEEAQ